MELAIVLISPKGGGFVVFFTIIECFDILLTSPRCPYFKSQVLLET